MSDPVSQPAAGAPAAVIDVTDASFLADVLERSFTTPVVVDLWAPWCAPCRQLGPLLEEAVAATQGEVVLAKVNVDENPQVSADFRVQGIPAVFAMVAGRQVDQFVGAKGRDEVQQFVARLVPTAEEKELQALLAVGDEPSLRAVVERVPGHEGATVALAELLAGSDRGDEALRLLATIPETTDTRRVAALARTADEDLDQVEQILDGLLDRVKADPDARQEFLDLLERLGPDDPRVPGYRKALTTRLF